MFGAALMAPNVCGRSFDEDRRHPCRRHPGIPIEENQIRYFPFLDGPQVSVQPEDSGRRDRDSLQGLFQRESPSDR